MVSNTYTSQRHVVNHKPFYIRNSETKTQITIPRQYQVDVNMFV